MTEELVDVKNAIRKFIVHELLFKNDELIINFEQPLIDEGIVDSVGLLALVQFLETQFDIDVSNYEMELDNFKNIDTITQMVFKLKAC